MVRRNEVAAAVLVAGLAAVFAVVLSRWPSLEAGSPLAHPILAALPPPEDQQQPSVHIITDATTGVQLYVRHWHDPSRSQPPPALLLLVHGATWHGGHFGPAAQLLVQRHGWAVVALDLPGHGASGSTTGIKGCHPGGLRGLAGAAGTVLAWAQQQLHPGVPTFLLGELLGAAVALTLLLQQQPDQHPEQQHGGAAPSSMSHAPAVQGLILTGPVVGVPRHMLPPPPALAVLLLLARLVPQLPIPDPRYSDEALWLQAFGNATLARAIWRSDPRIMKHMPVCAAAALLPGFAWLEAHRRRLAAPLLVLHGDGDVRAPLAASQDLVRELEAASSDRTLQVLPGAAHQLFQDRQEVTDAALAAIAAWVGARLRPAAAAQERQDVDVGHGPPAGGLAAR